MNNSGKTLTIFLVVIAVLLVSLTAIAVFFFLQEVELRKSAEYNLEQVRISEAKLQEEIKEAKKTAFVLEEKNKESDSKIESLMEDLELEQGLREEIKKDYRELRDVFEKDNTSQEKMKREMKNLEERNTILQKQIDINDEKHRKLQQQYEDLMKDYQIIKGGDPSAAVMPDTVTTNIPVDVSSQISAPEDEVQLDTIVVNSDAEKSGKIISIDKETNFVIVSFGEKDGIENGQVLSIMRNSKNLGDVKVTRVLPEMSAADFVEPLSSSKIRKTDRVVIKE